MDEIIAKILAQPAPTLPSDVKSELQKILRHMETFTSKEFKTLCDIYFKQNASSPLNNKAHLKEVDILLSNWFCIITLLTELKIKINIAWNRINNNIIGADDCIPIIIHLLPNDVEKLQQFSHELDKWSIIFGTGELAYSLVQLYSACEYKLNSMTSAHDISGLDIYEQRAVIIESDLHHFTLLTEHQQLVAAHKAYVDYIEYEIINKLSTETPAIYAKYCSMKKEELISVVTNELFCNDQISGALNCLIDKCLRLQDIGYTLNRRDRPVIEILSNFKEKYLHHESVLKAYLNKFNVSASSPHSYYMVFKYTADLLPIGTAETAFHTAALKLCGNLPGEQNITRP